MNKEHSQNAALWSRVGNITTRLGYVLYAVSWVLIVTAATVSFLDEYSSISQAIVFSALTALGLLIFLDVSRRILMYIIVGEPLLSKNFPLIAKILLALAILGAVITIPIYILHDLPREREEKATATAAYQKALTDLPSAQAERDKCVAVSNQNQESADCRRMKLGYNSCIENLSRAFCLASWDYESACKPSGFRPLFLSECYMHTSKLTKIIQEYEEKYHVSR
ncbi:MAG: hypothetical protein KA104_00740 [Candidatus Pacebacteria bacterium]|jgi:hypothetical protein|nr:hypothetical protein [Candidatus Paceibacterota bacterium]